MTDRRTRDTNAFSLWFERKMNARRGSSDRRRREDDGDACGDPAHCRRAVGSCGRRRCRGGSMTPVRG